MFKDHNAKITLILFFLLGTVVPFVDYLVIVELFYLQIPIVTILLVSLIYLTARVIFQRRHNNNKQILSVAGIVPMFILAQWFSVIAVSEIQKFRAERLIKQIEASGGDPQPLSSIGLDLKLMDSSTKSYRISYSRGFLMKEIYNSDTKSWRVSGWND